MFQSIIDGSLQLLYGNYGWIVAVPSWELLLLFLAGLILGFFSRRAN